MEIPDLVYRIWAYTLALTLIVLVPLAVYLLHRTWQAARSIQHYAAEALAAAAGIARGTQHIPALNSTVAVATEMVEVSGAVGQKLETIAGVLNARAR